MRNRLSSVSTARTADVRVNPQPQRIALAGGFIAGLGPLLVRNSPVDTAATAK